MHEIEIATAEVIRGNYMIYALQIIGALAIIGLCVFVWKLWTNR